MRNRVPLIIGALAIVAAALFVIMTVNAPVATATAPDDAAISAVVNSREQKACEANICVKSFSPEMGRWELAACRVA